MGITLEPFVTPNPPENISFAKVPADARFDLEPQSQAIHTVAVYAEGEAMGGPISVMTEHMGLTQQQAYDILPISGTTSKTLNRAMRPCRKRSGIHECSESSQPLMKRMKVLSM